MSLRPSEFCGGVDAGTVEDWMLGIEKHLQTVGCSGPQQVRLATFMLRGDVERWWQMARQRYARRGVQWAKFQAAFSERYVPSWMRE